MNGTYLALSGRIRTELNDVILVVDRAEELAAKAQSTGDDGYWDAVALNLHGGMTTDDLNRFADLLEQLARQDTE